MNPVSALATVKNQIFHLLRLESRYFLLKHVPDIELAKAASEFVASSQLMINKHSFNCLNGQKFEGDITASSTNRGTCVTSSTATKAKHVSDKTDLTGRKI